MKPTHLLGDKLRKSKFDPDLAARVNREVELEERRAALPGRKAAVSEPVPVVIPAAAVPVSDSVELSPLLVDPFSTNNVIMRNQDDWISYWRGITDGRVMASMGDLYLCFKQLKVYSEHGDAQQKAAAVAMVASLRDDFASTWLIAGTRVSYNPANLDGKITQHYQCRQPNLITQQNLVIPVYHDVAITEVVNEARGLKYLQDLLDTNDPAEMIIRTMEFISGKNRTEITVWTAATSGISTRESHPERVAGLYGDYSKFLATGCVSLYFQGYSRGVRL